MTTLTTLFLSFVFGLCLGSFLNVCIYRLPRDESVVGGRSYCPECGARISWYDNIPLFSYLALRGRCRECDEPISPVYPLVELASGLLLTAAAWKWFLRPEAYAWFNFALTGFLLLISLAIVIVDVNFSIIPNELTYTLVVTGLLAGLVRHYPLSTEPTGAAFIPAQFWQAFAGALTGGGIFFFLALISPLIYGKQALGMGDVKLMAGYGAWLGAAGALFIIVFGSLIGALVGSAIMLLSGRSLRNKIPFGPFLCLAGVIYLFCGPWLVDWYLSMVGPT